MFVKTVIIDGLWLFLLTSCTFLNKAKETGFINQKLGLQISPFAINPVSTGGARCESINNEPRATLIVTFIGTQLLIQSISVSFDFLIYSMLALVLAIAEDYLYGLSH